MPRNRACDDHPRQGVLLWGEELTPIARAQSAAANRSNPMEQAQAPRQGPDRKPDLVPPERLFATHRRRYAVVGRLPALVLQMHAGANALWWIGYRHESRRAGAVHNCAVVAPVVEDCLTVARIFNGIDFRRCNKYCPNRHCRCERITSSLKCLQMSTGPHRQRLARHACRWGFITASDIGICRPADWLPESSLCHICRRQSCNCGAAGRRTLCRFLGRKSPSMRQRRRKPRLLLPVQPTFDRSSRSPLMRRWMSTQVNVSTELPYNHRLAYKLWRCSRT